MPLARLADRVVVLDGGRVAQAGTPGELGAVAGPWREFQEAVW
jgi:ABC-type multidrug transport system fused ATPase/permease subunit